MIRVAIVEDTPSEQKRLEEYVRRYDREKHHDLSLSLFSDGQELLADYPADLDLILLDIDMAVLGGIETARKIRAFDTEVQILFVTRMVQFALEGYEVDAADYIVKPVPYPLFCARMDRTVKKILGRRPRFLEITAGREQHMLQTGQLVCAEALNKRTILHLADGSSLETVQPLRSLEKELEGEPFFRCHNAFLVHLGYVRSFSSSEAVLPFGRVPVSKYRKKEFLQALAGYRGAML